jgi:DUF1680 family protein
MTHLSLARRSSPLVILLPLFLFAARDNSIPDWKQQGVIFLDDSPNARQHPVPVQAVHVGEGFWSPRRRAVTDRSLPSLLQLLEEHGVVDNFRRLAGRPELPRRGPLYTDSDLYKWLEAAAWALASNETPDAERAQLKGDIDSLIGHVIAAQEPSGYLNTYYTGDKVHLRFTELTRSHEDYCLGHLLQAGIAYYRATGNRRLLDAGIRFADYVVDNFGPTKRPFVTGHPELEMAMVELYRTTRQTKYLDFARYLLSGVERDRLKLKDSDIHYMFSGKPFISRTEFEGHAVRALYAASGATDYFTETGDPAYKKTLDLLWADLTMRKMYITGGVGSRSGGESFGDPYELPSEQAYAETCAAIANVMWNYRLLALTGDARYADLLERALYNGVNSGISLSGNLYCYRNPLASSGDKLRNPWYDTTCCPPNIQRLFESLPAYFYSSSRDGIYLNLYHNSELDWHLDDGTPFKLTQSTNYPWAGDVRLTVTPAQPANFTVYVRWPAWAASFDVQVNGQPIAVPATHKGSFVPITRTWTAGDTVSLSIPLQTLMMSANPRLTDDFGRVAVQRGPLVYALEQIDQNGAAISDIFLKSNSTFTVEYRKDFLGGIAALKVPGLVAERSVGDEPLYQPYPAGSGRSKRMINLTLIPYYTVGNRDATPMAVWLPVSRSEPNVTSAASLGTEKHVESR